MSTELKTLAKLEAASRKCGSLDLYALYQDPALQADIRSLRQRGFWYAGSATQGNITEKGCDALKSGVLGPMPNLPARTLKNRKAVEALVWKHTHKDSKGTYPDGTKTVLSRESERRENYALDALVALSELTDAQLVARLPKAVQEKLTLSLSCPCEAK